MVRTVHSMWNACYLFDDAGQLLVLSSNAAASNNNNAVRTTLSFRPPSMDATIAFDVLHNRATAAWVVAHARAHHWTAIAAAIARATPTPTKAAVTEHRTHIAAEHTQTDGKQRTNAA